MADRYLLESGSPDGYLLEDGSGVLLLDAVVAASLTDNFDDNSRDTGKWNLGILLSSSTTDNGTVTETNQRVEILPATSAAGYSGYTSVNTEDLTGKRIFAKITNTAALAFTQEAILSFGQSAGNSYNVIVGGDGNVNLQKRVADSFTNLGSFAYNSTTHAWISLRLGTSGDDTVYLDTASSSASNPPLESEWVQRLSIARDSSISRSAAKMGFASGTFTSTTPGTIQFDGFNTATVGAAGAYTLTAASGSFSLTGTAATLKTARLLTAASASFALSGTAATLKKGFKLTAASGAFSLSGAAANLRVARKLTAAATSFALSGTAATLKRGLKLTAASGAFALTGTAATLTKSSLGAYTLTAASGTFALSGTAATLKRGLKLSAAAGSYSLSGTAATFRRGFQLTATPASYALSGSTVTLTASIAPPDVTPEPVAAGPSRPRRRRLKIVDYGMILTRPERR